VRNVGENLFRVELEGCVNCVPGSFFFLRIPGVGEKPFSPASDDPHVYYVRSVGPFTEAMTKLEPGSAISFRGPYGNGFPNPDKGDRIVLIAGGTGAAPIVMAGKKWHDAVIRAYAGFSSEIEPQLRDELTACLASPEIVVDPPGNPGEVVRFMAREMREQPMEFRDSLFFLCGPRAMMKAANEVITELAPNSRIFTAREDIMRCGIGICGSCGTGSGLRSCVDGPVMKPTEAG
jgi:dihydroorotate dehydrogenase (NAD+) catalytic subunit